MAGLNNSIFDLPSSLDELRRPEDVIKVSYRRIVPKASAINAAFPSNRITFDYTLSGNQHWLPSRSYVAIRDEIRYAKLAAGALIQPTVGDNVAPAWNCADNLWDSCQLTIGGFSLGSRTNFTDRISAYEKRQQKSKSWIEGVGASTQCMKVSQDARKQDIASDGIIADSDGGTILRPLTGADITIAAAANTLVGVGTLFLSELKVGDEILTAGGNIITVATIADDTNATHGVSVGNTAEANVAGSVIVRGSASAQNNLNERLYQPPLGVFKSGKALPPARYELILGSKPDSTYKQSAIESTGAEKVVLPLNPTNGVVANTVDYRVSEIVFYLAVVDNFEAVASGPVTYVLDLEETEVLPRSITAGNQNESFTVSKSTFSLGVAVQSTASGFNTLASPSKFITAVVGESNNITSLRVDYAGQSRPQPDAVILKTGTTDFQTWRYGQNAIEDLGFFDTGGVLTKEDWRELGAGEGLGAVFGFQWRRTGDDISTNVVVNVNYSALTLGNLLLFHSFRRVIEMIIENGQVTSFLAQDA